MVAVLTFFVLWHQGLDGGFQLSTVHQAALGLGQKKTQTLQELHGGDWRGRRRGRQRLEDVFLCQKKVLDHAPEGGASVSGQLLHQSGEPLVWGKEAHESLAHAMQPTSASGPHEWGARVQVGLREALWIRIRVGAVFHAAERAAAVQFSQRWRHLAVQD